MYGGVLLHWFPHTGSDAAKKRLDGPPRSRYTRSFRAPNGAVSEPARIDTPIGARTPAGAEASLVLPLVGHGRQTAVMTASSVSIVSCS